MLAFAGILTLSDIIGAIDIFLNPPEWLQAILGSDWFQFLLTILGFLLLYWHLRFRGDVTYAGKNELIETQKILNETKKDLAEGLNKIILLESHLKFLTNARARCEAIWENVDRELKANYEANDPLRSGKRASRSEWKGYVTDIQAEIERMFPDQDVDLLAHPHYSENQSRKTPGEEAIETEEDKKEFRMLSEQHLSTRSGLGRLINYCEENIDGIKKMIARRTTI
jgi:hypothetical protein